MRLSESAARALISEIHAADHALKDLWVGELTVVFQATVTYMLKDRRSVCVPYVDVLRVAGERQVEDYRIFIDLSPLMGALAKSGGGA